MYPFIRYLFAKRRSRHLGPLAVGETHVSQHRCMPWDIDAWLELNNGRTLTLYDLNRVPALTRLGLLPRIYAEDWGAAVVGVSVRFRQRIRAFQKVEIRARVLGWDHRFFYVEQSIWDRKGVCANNMLLRFAVSSANGIVPTDRVNALIGLSEPSPALPEWVTAWIVAESQRPWPPLR